MFLLWLPLVCAGAVMVGNYLFNLYREDSYEQDVNSCTIEDYKLADKLA